MLLLLLRLMFPRRLSSPLVLVPTVRLVLLMLLLVARILGVSEEKIGGFAGWSRYLRCKWTAEYM